MLRGLTAVSNPTLYYKLDPGEMGIAAPASASQSVLRVAAHELGNIHRFEAEAMEKGGILIYENIFLNRQFVGSFLAARSGESKAYIITGDISCAQNIIKCTNKNTWFCRFTINCDFNIRRY